MINRICNWLFLSIQCSWCHTMKHCAPLTAFSRNRASKWTSHGICKKCSTKFMEGV